MIRLRCFSLLILALLLFTLVGIALSPASSAHEWEVQVKPERTLRVVYLADPAGAAISNYAEGLVAVDKDNNLIPCLAKDWRWLDDRTIEFKLRQGVTFHNGETFNAETVRVNWENYRRMECPRPFRFLVLPDETLFETVGEYRVRFTFPEPNGLAFVQFQWFVQIAPAFFAQHKFDEYNYGYLFEAGPWGTGPFQFVEGSLRFGRPSD